MSGSRRRAVWLGRPCTPTDFPKQERGDKVSVIPPRQSETAADATIEKKSKNKTNSLDLAALALATQRGGTKQGDVL